MEAYKHTQIGYFLIIVYSTLILVMGGVLIITEFRLIPLVVLLVMLIVLGLFATLTVGVTERKVDIRFGLGVIRKSFLLEDIRACRVVRNPWYYGWGIRYTLRGWLFSVSGLSAVELQMKSGKTYRIGTDDPQKLAKALEEALS